MISARSKGPIVSNRGMAMEESLGCRPGESSLEESLLIVGHAGLADPQSDNDQAIKDTPRGGEWIGNAGS
jgi:hypothetical protein